MKTDNTKYYIVYDDGVFITELLPSANSVILNTNKDVISFDNESDFLTFKSTLKGIEDGI